MIVEGPALEAAALAAAVGAPWRAPAVMDEVDSTNRVVAEAARAGAAEGLVVAARRQTAGRGRQGRGWVAPAGSGLTFSVLLRPQRPADGLGWVPLLSGLAVLDTVRNCGVDRAYLKWPNDVLAPAGKLAGILAEVAGTGVVVGIGLNVNADPTLPPGATSLAAEGASVPDPNRLLAELLDALGACYRLWLDAPQALATRYRQACATLGALVRAELPGGRQVVGTAAEVDGTGRLVVDAGGQRFPLAAGDVIHLRC